MTNSKQSLSVEVRLTCDERKWLVEQLAAAWEWSEEAVECALAKDTAPLRTRAPLDRNGK